MIEELRLELARVQVQNHELKLLLQAKDNQNDEAISSKLTEYMDKVLLIYLFSFVVLEKSLEIVRTELLAAISLGAKNT